MASLPARIRWAPIALEAFFVVLGVVLALAANEWRQHVAARQRADDALVVLGNELQENRAAVAQSLAYHLALTDSLRTFGREHPPGAPAPMRFFSRGFVHPASVFSTAWETARMTGATAQMPYETVILLSRTYEEQGHYADQARTIGGLIYGGLFEGGTDAIRRVPANLGSIVLAVWYTECRLLERYDTTLAALGRDVASARPAACTHTAER